MNRREPENVIEDVFPKEPGVPGGALQTQQRMFKDAMKLGSAVSQLVAAHRRKQFKRTQFFFDRWKLHNLLARQNSRVIVSAEGDSRSYSSTGQIQIIQ